MALVSLGVNVAGDTAWLALVADGLVAERPDRYSLKNLPRPDAMLAALEDFTHLFQRHDIATVAVLDAHGNASPPSYQKARPRFTLELLIEIAAAKPAGVQYELLSPATVQARLGLPSRKLKDHVDEIVTKAGTHWGDRGPAALAALAAEAKN